MKVAMGLLAVGAVVLGVLQIPNVTHVVHDFLHPAFEESAYFEELEPSDAATYIGLLVGAVLSLAGIAVAYALFVKDPERRRVTALRTRFSAVHGFLFNKWYFDELIDLVIVRPSAYFGRFARDVFERVFVNGVIVGGAAGAVRLGSSAVRALQSGFLRHYAALLLLGVTALGLYFLVAAS
jgi:NADH-quinone oxidoreductase subunit L